MPVKIQLLKYIDNLLGPSLVKLASKLPERNNVVCQGNILILRPGGMGDAVLLLPIIQELKRQQSGLTVTVLAEKRNYAIFNLSGVVDRVLCYDRPADLLQVFRGSYDIIVDSEQWYRLSAILARLMGASTRIGFVSNNRRLLFTHQISYGLEVYERFNFVKLFTPIGFVDNAGDVDSIYLDSSPDAVCTVDGLLGDHSGRGFAAIFPGASVPEKEWGKENFARLGEKLYATGIVSVVLGGRSEALCASAVATRCNGLDLAGKTSVSETAAILTRASVLVSGDSGLLHLAASLGIPTVALFGPSDSRKWAPRGKHHRVISKKLPCSPCSRFATIPRCRYDQKCMSLISVEEVYAAVMSVFRVSKDTPNKY